MKSRIINFITYVVLIYSLTACNELNESERDKLFGSWKLIDSNENATQFKYGCHFSRDNQFFQLDSQGLFIYRNRPVIWELNGDTISVIDLNIEQELQSIKGIQTFLIKELGSNRLIMTSINPNRKQIYSFSKL